MNSVFFIIGGLFIFIICILIHIKNNPITKEEMRRYYRIIKRTHKSGNIQYIVQIYHLSEMGNIYWTDKKICETEKEANDYIDDLCGITYKDEIIKPK